MKTGINRHLSVALGAFEEMNDKTLSECFNGAPAPDVRAQLVELRSLGFTFYPCHCGNYDDKGDCKGVVIVGKGDQA